MKVHQICITFLAVVMSANAEAPASGPYPASSGPYPPSGWRPSGRLLVLPARQQTSQVYGPPPAEYGPPQEYGPPATEATSEAEPTEQPTEQPESGTETPERLVDSGVYYILQQDGKLQMVRYTSAPLQSQKFTQQKFQRENNFHGDRFVDASNRGFESQRVPQNRFQQQKHTQVSQVQAHHAQFQQQSTQFNEKRTRLNENPAQLNQQPQPFHYVEIEKSQEIQVAQPVPEQPAVGFVANVQYRDVEPISAPVYAYNPTPLVRILKK